jgi:hypothetical protein
MRVYGMFRIWRAGELTWARYRMSPCPPFRWSAMKEVMLYKTGRGVVAILRVKIAQSFVRYLGAPGEA